MDILNVVLPAFSQTMDHPTWVDSTNGSCSAATAYNLLIKEPNDMKGWKLFWKLKLPQKFKTFIWLVFQNKLPTNLLRARRGITDSDLCPRCNTSPENLGHLFRECPKAYVLWESIPSGRLVRRIC